MGHHWVTSIRLRSLVLVLIFLYPILGINGLKFIVEPEDTILPNSGNVILNCAARGEGQGQPRISWKKDGTLINLVGDNRSNDPDYSSRSILANGSLQISTTGRTRPDPSLGIYQCFVTLDGIGSILSRAAKVEGQGPLNFEEQPEGLTVASGQTARFGCSIGSSILGMKVHWSKDGAALDLDPSRMTVLPSGSLEISQVRPEDDGNYRCNLTAHDLSHISSAGRLSVSRSTPPDSAPKFIAVPKAQIVTSGSMVIFECSALAWPPPLISWLKDGSTIDLSNLDSRFSLIGERNLVISKVEESDRGTYQCRAENREDSIDVSARLDVQVSPRVLTKPSNFFAYQKEDVELPCKIYGKPPPSIQWYKNGDLIIEGDYFQIVNENNLKIMGLVSSDAGMYQCFGTNPAGNVQLSVHLSVLEPGEAIPEFPEFNYDDDDDELELDPGQGLPNSGGASINNAGSSNSGGGPSAPRDLVALLVSSRFVTLSWKSPLRGRVLTYAVYYKEIDSDRERVLNTTLMEDVNVPGLQPNKRYSFRVVPYNEGGPGDSTLEISLLTQPEVDVPGAPRNLKGSPKSPTRIDLSWAPPELGIGVNRYKVYYSESGLSSQDYEDTLPPAGGEVGGEDPWSDFEDDDDYSLPGAGAIQTLTVDRTEAILDDLRIYTEYLIWVVGINGNGPGASSNQIKVTTFSDAPADTPHNVSLEPSSSTSILVRWDPPPLEFRNGILTGYKIKYKQKGRKRAETITTDGNTRSTTIVDLERGVEYQVKISALNINGTGPFTDWVNAVTFTRDLEEDKVPGKPGSLQALPLADSITITWTPPTNPNILVRGYTIGWGKGIPDVYSKLVEGQRRYFSIDKLKPNSDYVISLRAYNQMGDGIPIYENVRTREGSGSGGGSETLDPAMVPPTTVTMLSPPVGLRATVMSPTSIVVSWTDTSKGSDRRHYVVRYAPAEPILPPLSSKGRSSHKYANSSTTNLILNDLRPSATYEFSVKVVRGRQSSEWSLVAINKTRGLGVVSPHGQPQDLTLMAVTGDDETSSVILNWQPPKLINPSELKGYLIFYTTNPSLKEWVEEVIPEDVLTHQVKSLTPDTTYYFRMSAKHLKSYGQSTETKSVTTPASRRSYSSNTGRTPSAPGLKSNQTVLYILIGLSVAFAMASLILCLYYRKRGLDDSPKQTTLKKTRKPELKPPDLWIHHDQMELKGVGGKGQVDTPLTPSVRGSRDFDVEEKAPLQHHSSTMEKSSYLNSYLESTRKDNHFQSQSLGRKKPKPIHIPVEPFFKSRGGAGPGSTETRVPAYTRNSQSHLNVMNSSILSSDGLKGYDSHITSGSSTASSQHNLNINTGGQYSGTSDYGTQSAGSSHGTLTRRPGSNLKSFTVLPPYNTPPPNKVNIRPMTAVPISPLRRASGVPPILPGHHMSNSLSLSSNRNVIGHGNGYGGNTSPPPLQKCYSTEELSQEISHLEGLMKDLSAITASEFQC